MTIYYYTTYVCYTNYANFLFEFFYMQLFLMMTYAILYPWRMLPDLVLLLHRQSNPLWRWAGSILISWHTSVHVWTYRVSNWFYYVYYMYYCYYLHGISIGFLSLLYIYCWLTSYHYTLGLAVSTDSKGCVDLCSIPHTGIVMPKKIFDDDFCC